MKNLDPINQARSQSEPNIRDRARVLVTLLGPELFEKLRYQDPFFESLMFKAISDNPARKPNSAGRPEDLNAALVALVETLEGATKENSSRTTPENDEHKAETVKQHPLWASDLLEGGKEHPAIVSQHLAKLSDHDRSERIGRLSPRLAKQVLKLLIEDT